MTSTTGYLEFNHQVVPMSMSVGRRIEIQCIRFGPAQKCPVMWSLKKNILIYEALSYQNQTSTEIMGFFTVPLIILAGFKTERSGCAELKVAIHIWTGKKSRPKNIDFSWRKWIFKIWFVIFW